MRVSTILLVAGAAAAFLLYSRKASASGSGFDLSLPSSLDDVIRQNFPIDPFKLNNPWDATSMLPSPLKQPVTPEIGGGLLDWMTTPGFLDNILKPVNPLDSRSASTGANFVMKQWTTPAVGQTGPGKFGPEKVVFDGTQYDQKFRQAEVKYGLPYGLLSRMAWQESRYNPGAVSPVGAVGLMQIMPATAKGYGVAALELTDATKAIDLAGRILKDFYAGIKPATARSWPAAIVAYNQGPGNVNKAIAEKGPMIGDWLTASNIGPDGRGYYQIAVDVGLAPAGIAGNLSSANVAGIHRRG